jgi:hypothetical protein
MRIIPIILVLLFTLGCKTADVRERHVDKTVTVEYQEEKTTKKANAIPPTTAKDRKIVKKTTKIATSHKPPKKISGKKSVIKKIEVAALPEPAIEIAENIDHVPPGLADGASCSTGRGCDPEWEAL